VTLDDSSVVLGFFNNNPLAKTHAAVDLVGGLWQSAARQGLCHSLSTIQKELSTAGVKFQDSLLPGEVVSQ